MFMWIMAVLAGSASVGPVLLGYLLTRVPRWQWIFLIAGAGLWVAGSIWHRLVAKGLEPVTIRESGAAGERLSARDLLLSPALWLMGFLVTLDMLASGGILSWTPRLLQIRHGADETVAGLVLTAMTIGMLAGRIVLGVLVSGRLSDRVLLGGSYALAMAAYGALLLVPNQTTAFVLMVVVGAATSAQAPSIYSLATYKFATRAAVACPLVDAIGNLGGFAGPAGLGVLADRFGGLERVIWIAPALGFLLAAVSLGWELIDRWSVRPPSSDATEAVMP
jgi:fucose permease